MKNPIAIVGIGCRFAGSPDVQAYWQLTVDGRDAFAPVPADRWSHEQFHDENPRATDKSYAPNGGFIDDVRTFPALALGIPPRRVEVMDPQQRHSLEMARAAIQDAGYRPGELPHRTGVFVGVTASEWKTILGSRVAAQMMASGAFGDAPDSFDALSAAVANVVPSRPFTAPGALSNMIASAVAQELDLHGPAFTVDAACASGLVAAQAAVDGLRAGTIDCALAGGVYIALTPENHIAFSRIGAISKSGACRPFDARADGFVQGDGAGALVLKRLEDAERDGDRIYAVIHGIATNNDGRGDGPMAPVLDGQVEVVRRAWEDAGLSPAKVGYVEAHGTGTTVGDRTELTGLKRALGTPQAGAALGSSKANVGHTMSAAGIAGLIRAALAIHHGVRPPMAGFASAKPELGLEGSGFHIPTAAEPWPGDRVAGVSSFGFGGTNAHVVLAEAPVSQPSVADQPELLTLSAATADDLATVATQVATCLEAGASVASVARALAVRTPLPHRAALVTDDPADAAAQLRAFAAGDAHDLRTGEAIADARVAYLFPGQGAQRVGMLRDASERFPVLAQTVRELDAALDLPVPIEHLLYPERRPVGVDDATAAAQLTDTGACQPAMFACSLGLARLLSAVGVQPIGATGHSLGEFNAAVEGGVIDAIAGARFVARRAAAMAAVPGDGGAMAAVMADASTVRDLLDDGVVIANINHPRQLVVSGTTQAVAALVQRASDAGITAKPLEVSHAFHSPLFDGLDAEPWLDGLQLADPARLVASGIASAPYASAEDARGVFLRHTRSPVDFVGALQQLVDAGANLLLQVGAGGPLASFARGAVGDKVRGVHTLAGRRDDDGGRSLLEGLGWLWCHGVGIDVRPITAPAPTASLPPERLPREPYWPVKDKAQRKLALTRVADAPPAAATAPANVHAPAAPVPAATDEDAQRVFRVIAKVSAYPVDALKPGMRLVDDLGFDSLMVGDMATGLAEAFPGLGGIPQELLINSPTVQDLVDFVRSADHSAEDGDDDAPLGAWRPCWVPSPRVGEQPRDLRGAAAWVHPLAAGRDALCAGLAARGVEIVDADDAPVELIVWAGDDVGALIARLADQADRGASPDLLALGADEGPSTHAVAGAVRAWGAEADVVAKTLWGAFEPGAVLGEWLDAERSTDVRSDSDGLRWIQGFEPAPLTPARALAAGSRVLITGGTRGIGLDLARRLEARGCDVTLLARSPAAIEGLTTLVADVTDAEALAAALQGHRFDAVVHAAGVLADGAVQDVDPAAGGLARRVKIDGFANLLRLLPDARVVLGIGSWAGRFGNRHQLHYAAGNAGMAGLAACAPEDGRAVVVAEFGPWTHSEMVRSIPAPIQATMRAEGVDFVGDQAGLDALVDGLLHGLGVRTHGRDLPLTTRTVRLDQRLDTATHPYLLDHAIEGTPVLPLAAAADLLAWAAGVSPPFQLEHLQLFQGVTVSEPTPIQLRVRGDRAELRVGERHALAYRARVRPVAEDLVLPEPVTGGAPPPLALAAFYDGGTFHGPMLQGICAIDGVGDDFVRGRVRAAAPRDWVPSSDRQRFAVDPLALDSAMQLSGYVALTRYERAGTPVGIGRLLVLGPLDGELVAEVRFGEREDDRFSGTVVLRTGAGQPRLVAFDTVAELRKLADDGLDGFEVRREWIDPSAWPGLQDIDVRLQMAEVSGIRNPYFTVHEGTARNTTRVGGRELINFSSYNYLGLSGDARVLGDVKAAVDRYGTSVSASRVASGERPFHGELERLLAQCQDTEDALVFTAGHATNVTAIGHLMGAGDLVLHDELIHDSALQGIKLAGCARRGFKHDDPADLESQLRELRRHYQKVLIVVEGVYSMDGDICDMPSYIALKKKYGCLLMCDEAHSFGVVGATGQGVREHFGFRGTEVDLWMGTLSKSVASCGGWLAGSAPLIRYLRYTAPGFVYSAGITAANGVAALSALRLMLAEPERVQKLQANAMYFHDQLVRRGIDTGPALGGSAVIPVVTGNSLHALMLSQRLLDGGINVQPIVYPAVADDSARLRFFLSSTHSFDELSHTAEQVATLLEGIREEFPLPGQKKARASAPRPAASASPTGA